MSARQRLVPLMLASFIGVASGVYIFDPLLKQYAADSRGTYDPKVAQAAITGGVGGGVNDVSSTAEGAKKKGEALQGMAKEKVVLHGREARERLSEVLENSQKQQKQNS